METCSKKTCEVCQKEFVLDDLFPTAMIREVVFQSALSDYPNLDREGYICLPDLRKIHADYYESVLEKERGILSELEREVLESIATHELLSEDVNEEYEEQLTFGEHLADRIARFGGSWGFISLFLFVLFFWMGVNTIYFYHNPFDPYPFILLNLVLSCLAAIQAPIIMMSQNRQASKDRLSFNNNFQTNLKSELMLRQLNTRMELFMKHYWQKVHEISRMQEELVSEFEAMNKSGG